jgi:hypothetical protein
MPGKLSGAVEGAKGNARGWVTQTTFPSSLAEYLCL